MPNDLPEEALKAFREYQERRESREHRFGHVRPTISLEFGGYRIVAIGNSLLWSKNWRTFHDFLDAYLKAILGEEWGKEELRKPPSEAHIIIQWFRHVIAFTKAHEEEAVDGVFSAERDGIVTAYLTLAYELYLLRHHGKLQESLLTRLRNPDQFQGARYELFVIASFLRAGLDPVLENESDVTRKHPEFTFLDPGSGLNVEVEAKSKHRPGVLGRDGEIQDLDAPRSGVRNLLRSAAGKGTGAAYVVFVDVNYPPLDASVPPPWTGMVDEEVNTVVGAHGGHSPFDLLFFTSLPYHYSLPGEPVPVGHLYEKRSVSPHASRIPIDLADRLVEAVRRHDNVPVDFDE